MVSRKMTSKKIQMKRIDNTTTWQVTFSKRRKCIFKKGSPRIEPRYQEIAQKHFISCQRLMEQLAKPI
ncbi:hypothetical protein I3842_12G016300 [Carya illinoinensis]|uniref:MADS-box domain-containing protein n=1 Tax=Carya illinoinensis TaxID=32201 RepID=A0A922DFQ6_CARIL|nr:hypothetical protein I3842_12G016300 [Carya illinoinensis]